MNLTPKYPNCQNCGANDYEMNSLNTVKCEYCGTEYEIELPEEPIIQHDIRDHYNPYITHTYILTTI